MSISLLGGDITVYFSADTGGDKQIKWTGGTTVNDTRTLNELYTAIQDLFDNNTGGIGDYMQYGSPIKAITPRVYEFGRIETNDDDPWFIDQTTIEHLTGGSIQTLGWSRNATYRGIVRVPIQNTFTIVAGDVGNTITSSAADSGKLLYVEQSSYGNALWIRPDSTAASNNFDSATSTLTCNGHTATQTSAATTGNNLWVNIYTVGSIESTEEIIVGQRLTANAQPTILTRYWRTGLIDRMFLQTLQGTKFDNGQFFLYQKTENKLYDYYSIQTSDGRNVAPITSSIDLNNTTDVTSANGITVTFASSSSGITADIDQNSTSEFYGIQINCNGQTLQYVYQYIQYYISITAGIETFSGTNSLLRKTYVGPELYLQYTSLAGSLTAGDTVIGGTSSARATIIAVDPTNKKILLQNVRGTFSPSETLTTSASASISTISNITSITPNKQAPFGMFAGGRFFAARGVVLTNVAGSDINNYQTQDFDGNIIYPPSLVSFSLTGLKNGTEVRIHKTSDNSQVAGVEDITNGSATSPTTGVTTSGSTDNNTFTYTYTYASDIDVYVVILNLDYQYYKIDAITLSNTTKSIPIVQIFDRNYSNP